MREAGLLQRDKIESIIKFKKSIDHPNEWDPKLFESYLQNYKEYSSNNPDECDFIDECLKLFNLPLLNEKAIKEIS